ncbi:helix-turn-helix domain-containing protein [Nocardioides sp. Root140]|uniref:helix-turn-helix domain-containing protein n=1 Tax=Nocardioides sp. Root140 TaxID=1736460 RepID=UPI000AF78257|nr:phage DNA packaging protein J [Nocardioides sp. Root140]
MTEPEVSPRVAAEIVEDLSRPGVPQPLRLTEGETKALRLIADGLTYSDVARRLYVSETTIDNHARNTQQKAQMFRDWPA